MYPRNLKFENMLICVGFALVTSVAMGQALGAKPDVPLAIPQVSHSRVLMSAIKAASVPLNRQKPDFSMMDRRFSDARIIGVGQQTHGTSEIFTAQCDLMRYGIEKHGVRAILFESGYSGLSIINDSLKTKNATPINMAGVMETFQVAPLRDFFEWVRKWNLDHPVDTVEVIGVDLQNVTFSGFEKDILAAVKPEETGAVRETLRRMAAVLPVAGGKNRASFYRNVDVDAHTEARIEAIRLHRRFERELGISRKPETEKAYLATKSFLNGLEYSGTMIRSQQFGQKSKLPYLNSGADSYSFREKVVAEYVLTFAGLFPQRKLMWFAHSGHLIKAPTSDWYSMGAWIAGELGPAFCSVSVTTAKGAVWTVPPQNASKAMSRETDTLNEICDVVTFSMSEDSFEGHMLRYANSGDLLIDISKGGDAFSKPLKTLHINQVLPAASDIEAPLDLSTACDFVIFLGKTTASRPLPVLEKF